jgi:hypothetical protein
MEDIVSNFLDEEFADEDFWPGPPHQREMAAWERFKHIVKHERRYTFWHIVEDPRFGVAETQPSEMLKVIGEAIHFTSLTKTLSPGTKLWRVRVHKPKESLKRASEISAPPLAKAIYPNRMSPSGVPMFYGADDFDTATLETIDPNGMRGKRVTGASFRNIIPLNMLDLTAIPAPSDVGFFCDWTREVREAIKFLRAFTVDISKPVAKDESQHTEYVPTQVFTEFIRYELRTPEGQPYHGIKYPSSVNGKGCYVLFVGQEECLSRKVRVKPQVLSFVKGSWKAAKKKTVAKKAKKKAARKSVK